MAFLLSVFSVPRRNLHVVKVSGYASESAAAVTANGRNFLALMGSPPARCEDMRLIGSTIGDLLGHRHGRCVRFDDAEWTAELAAHAGIGCSRQITGY
jgi:hypothetical protein